MPGTSPLPQILCKPPRSDGGEFEFLRDTACRLARSIPVDLIMPKDEDLAAGSCAARLGRAAARAAIELHAEIARQMARRRGSDG